MGTCSSTKNLNIIISKHSPHPKEILTVRINEEEEEEEEEDDDDDDVSYYSALEDKVNTDVSHIIGRNTVSLEDDSHGVDDDTMSYHTVIDINSSDEVKEQKLQMFQKMFPNSDSMDLLAFLKFRDYDLEEAELQYRNTLAFRKNAPKLTIIDVAPFMMTPPGNAGPDGCFVLLEDGKGDCARDKMGRPVLVQVGMMHGNRYEHLIQALYTNKRVSEYIRPGCFPEVTLVMECQPRKGAIGTFRFPDENTKALINMQREHHPGGLNSKSHFCDIPSVAVWAFHLVKPFMPKEVFENIELRSDFKHLPNYISKENMLVEWGGSFHFDFNQYVKWRAAEEGVSHLLSGVQPRRYDATTDAIDVSKIPITDLNRGLVDIYSLNCHLTCQKLSQHQPSVRKYGMLWKVGSGKGFGTNRWKKKMLFIGGVSGIAIYFDTTDAKNNTLKPSEVISLAAVHVRAVPDSAATVLGSQKGYWYQFSIKASSRNFVFGCDSIAERDEWIDAIENEISSILIV